MDKESILIFDFDGTIADTLHSLIAIYNRIADDHGFKRVEDDKISKLQDNGIQETLQYLNIPLLKFPMIVAKAKKELHKEIEHVNPIEGLKEILKQFKSLGFKMGILSSNSLKNVTEFLKNNELDLFDFIHSTSKIWSKNHSLKTLMNKNQLNNSQVVYIGDETRDIIAAQKAGIRSIAVTWGYNSSQALEAHHPDHLIHSPQELLHLFQ